MGDPQAALAVPGTQAHAADGQPERAAPAAPARTSGAEATLAAVARARGVVLGRTPRGAPSLSNRAAARILARAPSAAAPNPPNGRFRQEVLAVLKPFAETLLTKGDGVRPDVYGAAEGTALFDTFIPAASADAARRQTADQVRAGTTGKNTKWTSCIAFLTGVLGRGATASGAQVPAMGGTDAEAKAQKRPGAWHPGTEIETNSPSPGDVYVFHYPDDHKERPGYFSHSGANDDKDDRVLRGWVDIDQLVTAPPGYGYGYADDPLNTGAFEPSVPPVRPGPVRTTVIQPR